MRVVAAILAAMGILVEWRLGAKADQSGREPGERGVHGKRRVGRR